MLVIYHSETALAAREAAALHTHLFDEADLAEPHEQRRALAILGGTGVLASRGLWYAGRDKEGRSVMALGRTSGARWSPTLHGCSTRGLSATSAV